MRPPEVFVRPLLHDEAVRLIGRSPLPATNLRHHGSPTVRGRLSCARDSASDSVCSATVELPYKFALPV